MTKALLKKQLLEMLSPLYRANKSGGRRSPVMIVLYVLLLAYAFGAVGVMFGLMADSLCVPLAVSMNTPGLYFALMGTVATALGVFGSIFTTYVGLYQAKDNELLLSMPIPPRMILMSRMIRLYLTTLFFEALVLVPTEIVWFMNFAPTPQTIVGGVVLLTELPLLALGLSCILGWVIALVAGRFSGKSKNFVTMVLSIGFIVVYYWGYSKAYAALQLILLNSDKIDRALKIFLYPIHQMGRGAAGELLPLAVGAVLIAAFFAVIYYVLSVSFLKIATGQRGDAKKKYKRAAITAGSVDGALLKREFLRFTGSAVYMLNCGLGVLMMPAAAVAALIKRDMMMGIVAALPQGQDMLPLIAAGMMILLTSTAPVTAPSVSLEGKHIWIAQSLPVSPWQVLRAKLRMGLILTVGPAVISSVLLMLALDCPGVFMVLVPMAAAAAAVFSSLLGLWLNLLLPNLNWTNEAGPVKQGASVCIALFGGWGMVVALGALYWLVHEYVSAALFIGLGIVLLAVLSAALYAWVKTRGAKIFAQL